MFVLQNLLIFILCPSLIIYGAEAHALKNYIVYMGDVAHPTVEATISSNQELLARVTSTRVGVNDDVIRHYTKSFRGKTGRVSTTHSWEFMGINQINSVTKSTDMKDYLSNQSDIIIGVIDNGVWPESKSFNDVGLPRVPSRFKGTCQTGHKFNAHNCNRKIIGTRFHFKGYEAQFGPLESHGGTFFRSPRIARGGAPAARLAIYKACWFFKCTDADILAAFDDAVHDGVDIISISLVHGPPQPSYFVNPIAIGSFHAFRSGILVSASAGNDGLPGSVGNVAPWILTVGASTIDRSFISNVLLGNNIVLTGEAVNPHTQNGFVGLVAGSSSGVYGIPRENASLCQANTLGPAKVKGKVVVCTISEGKDFRYLKGQEVKRAGGVGIIVIDPIENDVEFQFVIPGTEIGAEQGAQLMAYMASEKNPIAYIESTSTVLNTSPAPQMAVFSSLGPNSLTPDIIKPDITAPGVNILAAWSPVAVSLAGNRSVDFNTLFGTSMSCPHVSGVVAIIKSHHPTWSPAAIQSAIMTTAFVTDKAKKPIIRNPAGNTAGFDYGSGHINPIAALDPGLIYDYDVTDMIKFLCSIGATAAQLKYLTGGNDGTRCMANSSPPYNLNYPSIVVANLNGSVTVSRTLTNYGSGSYVYEAVVQPPPGVDVKVLPRVLRFKKKEDKFSFQVLFKLKKVASKFVFGSLTWSDGKHKVYSPIAVNPTLA
ncbi:hypothetical protein SUGI_1183210 [Cryptomeria japonica]|nr:hypothetical protein SUGI_1183210 [Cryptomeria japonica]